MPSPSNRLREERRHAPAGPIPVPEPVGATYRGGVEDQDLQVAVDVPMVGDERHKHWAKVVYSVDTTQTSGWAFDGEFIAAGGVQDVPINSVILVYGEKGSRNNPQIEARVFTANSDGTLSHHVSAKGRAWARTLRDQVEDLLAVAQARPIEAIEWGPELMRYSDAALQEELDRRLRTDRQRSVADDPGKPE